MSPLHVILAILISLSAFAQIPTTETTVAEPATEVSEDAPPEEAADAAEFARPSTEFTRPSTSLPGVGKSVVIVPLRDVIDDTILYVLRRGFDKVLEEKSDAMIIDMNTPGGSLNTTEEIIQRIREIRKGGTKVYTFVNSDAISAGAITALACDGIFMGPASRIGDAMPILMGPGGPTAVPDDLKEKVMSPTRALVRALAQENDYLEELALSMVDPDVEFKVGDTVICAEGELLTLTADEAVAIHAPMETPLLAQAVVGDVDELLAAVGLGGATISRIEASGSENLARWITTIAPLLMALAVLGIYIEVQTPGVGVFGFVGVTALVILLFGHNVAGLTGQVDLVLIVLGMVLLLIEMLVLPGFGVAGLLGIIALGTGMVMAMIPHMPSGLPDLPGLAAPDIGPYIQTALLKLSIGMVLTVIGGYFISKWLPNTSFYGRLVLETTQEGYVSTDVDFNQSLVGKIGVTTCILRPSGIAEIDGRRIDVVSNGDFIQTGQRVVVSETEGARIVVSPAPEPATDADAATATA
ncbi:MAG: membrane-bound serine protease (ClpP class) [Rhodothermales bacterium]|jgi:membrane-bound serine protease (ClpP class)